MRWIEMLSQRYEMLSQRYISRRWKEWIPLVTQQLRLRNLVQVIAYNVNFTEKQLKCDDNSQKVKIKTQAINSSFYYTLHLTTMSAPFYTSEKLESENPKWTEIELGSAVNGANASVNGIVIRLWVHRKSEQDQVITVWGVYFSGLMYLGPKLSLDPKAYCLNTIIFHMQGGYFTAPQCVKDNPKRLRLTKVFINAADVRPSYTVNLVSRLHTIQQAIKKQMSASQMLKEKILAGGYTSSETRESATLRRLLNKTRPLAPLREELLKIRREIEIVKFRVEMLTEERARKYSELRNLDTSRITLSEQNQDRGMELMNNYQTLHKDIEQLKEKRKVYLDAREAYLISNNQLIFRQKQLISKLNQIYPVVQVSKDKFTIGGVHLPDSEDFAGYDDIMISVALGYVAHVIQMISVFLQVPLRYPVIHFGSWSKIIDYIVAKIPEKDREFPLYSRGKDKLQFHYGVYLLNKNISQLRWYCGLPTQDLRTTLANLSGLLHLQPSCNVLENYRNTSSGSSDLNNSLQSQNTAVNAQTESQNSDNVILSNSFHKGHRISKSMGSSEMQLHLKTVDVDHANKEYATVKNRKDSGLPLSVAKLSYSLDKGLDEYEGIKKAEISSESSSTIKNQGHKSNLGYIGSEPILTPSLRDSVCVQDEDETTSSADEAKKHFLQNWQAGGGFAPVFSDDDTEVHETHTSVVSFSEQSDKISVQNMLVENTSSDLEEKNQLVKDVSDTSPEWNSNKDSSIIPESPVLHNGAGLESDIKDVESNQESCENYGSRCVMESPLEEDVVMETSNASSVPLSLSCFSESCKMSNDIQEKFENKSEVSFEDITHFIDNTFANVASRTEALANRSGSFNLVRSKHGSYLEDGNL